MWPRVDPLVSLLAVTAVGWLWGSFLNQVIDRTPRRRREQGSAAPRPVGLLRPVRSLCLHCAATLPWHDNIPIASYLWLRGRCRFCATPIGRRTLLIDVQNLPVASDQMPGEISAVAVGNDESCL